MKLVDFLRPELVLHDLNAVEKDAALREICHFVAGLAPSLPDEERLFEGLLERERLRSTGIGDHVAIPHGRFAGLPNLVAAFARSRRGIRFVGTDDNEGTFHHFVVLFAPENSAGLHLKALARITRLFKSPELRQGILDAPDAAAIHGLIAREDAKY